MVQMPGGDATVTWANESASPARRPTSGRWSSRERHADDRMHHQRRPRRWPARPTAARSASSAGSPGRSSTVRSGRRSCSSASPSVGSPKSRSTPPSTSCPAWSTPPEPTRWAVSCSAGRLPTRPRSSARGRSRRSSGLAVANDCDTVVFDDELSPAQQYNLERMLGRTAIDRAAVILDIFAQNASSQEGKAQVELAQLRYRLPESGARAGRCPSRPATSASRGPGETQLEVDRRRLLRRVHKLEGELRDISRNRDTQRKSRRRSGLRHVVIVGYTNAGKSTLLNRLTDAGVLVEDRLFATLDATTRRLDCPGGETVLCTDTVGFVRKLPHQLVEAFKSTLVVTTEADLLVHVVDCRRRGSRGADPGGARRAGGDRRSRSARAHRGQQGRHRPGCGPAHVADHTERSRSRRRRATGIDGLLVTISDRLRSLVDPVELHIPYSRGDLIAALHRSGQVLTETATEDGLVMRAQVGPPTSAGSSATSWSGAEVQSRRSAASLRRSSLGHQA